MRHARSVPKGVLRNEAYSIRFCYSAWATDSIVPCPSHGGVLGPFLAGVTHSRHHTLLAPSTSSLYVLLLSFLLASPAIFAPVNSGPT